MTTRINKNSDIGAWKKIVQKCFSGNTAILHGRPNVCACAGVPDFAAKLGTLCWDSTNKEGYICTVISGTWVKLNA